MSPNPQKRTSLAKIGKGTLASVATSSLTLSGRHLLAQTSSSSSNKTSAISQFGQAFLERTGIPGLSVAFARNGQIVHQEAFGSASLERKEKLSPAHSFRIASVSKPITAVVIFVLVERGVLRVTDKVFGPQGILRAFSPVPEAAKSMTVHHLLTHSCGGWGNRANDPMFMHPDLNHAELIHWTLNNLPLSRAPGTSYEYSNFGYCLLGRIIEKVTGKSYSQATNELVLNRAGISKMQIAGNAIDQKAPNEVQYHAERAEDPYSINVSRMDSHGGWIGTPSELVKFANSVDGFRPSGNLLQSASIAAMTNPSANNPGYASGWAVNSAPNWWHTGSLAGTTGLLVRTASGMCWAACANARTSESGAALDDIMWKMARSVPGWQA
jgi:CubicO group peptidase (beta-lactamase class C family)